MTFNPQGSRILTASSDKTAKLWDPMSGRCLQVRGVGQVREVRGWDERVGQVRGWEEDTLWSCCVLLQTLEGHADEIFSCAFNYEGDTIITGQSPHTHPSLSTHTPLTLYTLSTLSTHTYPPHCLHTTHSPHTHPHSTHTGSKDNTCRLWR